MKKIILLLLGVFPVVFLYAQSTITGRISDEKDRPVRGATVFLVQQKDSSLVLSALSDANGGYSFQEVKNGNYAVTVSLVGYTRTFHPVQIAGKAVQIPEIKLQPQVNTLVGVTVTATKPFLEQRADKLVVNVESSATAAGSTALEVLQKVPGVIVRNETVTLAGKSSVQIMIDGRPSQYTDINQVLANLSAANIEKIELITNPGARYDAAGGAIINILLKKTANLGTNGNVGITAVNGLYKMGDYGVDRNFFRISPSVFINHRKGKINTYGSANFLHRNTFETMELDREIQPNIFKQSTYSPSDRNSYSYRAGLDYYADNKNTFGLLVRGFGMEGLTNGQNTTVQIDAASGNPVSSFQTFNNTSINRTNIAGNLNWKHSFDSTGKEINIDLDYSSFQLNSTSDITNQVSASNKYTNSQIINNPVNFFVSKLDYAHPFTKNTRMELGAKSSFATIDNYLKFLNSGVVDPTRGTDFRYKENINAVYSSIAHKMESWEFNMGLRTEQTVATGRHYDKEVLNRNYWQLFPSVFVSNKITKDLSTVAQYSRRVNRPSYQQQNPFIQYLDSLTYTRGNPLLRPEITDAFKLGLTYQNQPFFSVSYNRTYDVIFDDAPKQDGNLTYTTPENLAQYSNIVFELNFPIQFGKKISGYGGNQFIYNHYKAVYLGGFYNRGKWNWQAYWQVAYKPTPAWNIEVSGFYLTPFLNEFIEIGDMGSLNFAVQHIFWEKKARLTLNFNDILFSQRSRGLIQYQEINVAFRQANETRNVRLAFNYSFGNQKLKAVRNRSTGSDAEANRVKTN